MTSYFDKGWNAFAQQKDGSIQWIPEQIVGIGEDFHSQVDDDKVKTTLYKVRWSRRCGTPCEMLQFPNIIRKDRRLQFGSWTVSILS